MDARRVEVLLIESTTNGYSPLSSRLEKRGCNPRFARRDQEVSRLLSSHRFDLVLGPIRLHGQSLYPLIRRLEGSGTTLFYSQEVEDNCWWLPAHRLGRNCFGAPALLPGEFAPVLDRTIEELRRSVNTATETQSAFTSRFLGSIVAVPFSRMLSISAAPLNATSPNLAARKSAI